MVENRFRSIWQNRGEDLLAFELERFHIVEYVFVPWHEQKLALRLKPSAGTHLELGIVEGQLGNLSEAAAQFRHAIQLDSGLADVHLMLGVVLRRQADHKGALEQFQPAVALNPHSAEAQYNLGRELKVGGDTDGAIAAFDQ